MVLKHSNKSVASLIDKDKFSTNSDATPVHKTKKSLSKSPFHLYYMLTVTTLPACKAVEIYQKNICYFYTKLLEVDEDICIIVYQSDPEDDKDFKNFLLPIN